MVYFQFSQKLVPNPTAFAAGLLLFLVPCLVKSAPEIELLWKNQLGTAIHLPPVITGKFVVATTASGTIYSFNRETGQLNWVTNKATRFWDRSLVVHDSKFVAGRAGGILQAHSLANGKMIWRVDLGVDAQARPLVVEDTLYVPTTHVGTDMKNDPEGKAVLYAIDGLTGDVKWARKTENYALQKPSYHNHILYIAGSYHDPSVDIDEGGPMRVTALGENGEDTIWEYKGEDGFVKAIYADEKTVTFVGYQDFINALDSKSGQLRWRLDTGNWTPSLLGADGVIYYGSATTNVYAVSSETGDVHWQFNIGGGSFNYLLGEPVIDNGVLYFLTQRGDIYALEAESGQQIWAVSTNIDARAGLSVDGDLLITGGIDGSLQAYRIQ